MKIIPKFTKGEITKLLTEKQKRLEDAVIMRLRRIGESFVTNARDHGSYKDRTGNLRSSIGYVILKNGEQLYQNLRGEKGEGKKQARKVIAEIVPKFPRGFVLICVAGMDYAAAVESKGLDVLTASSQIAETELKSAIKDISGKIGRM